MKTTDFIEWIGRKRSEVGAISFRYFYFDAGNI